MMCCAEIMKYVCIFVVLMGIASACVSKKKGFYLNNVLKHNFRKTT